MCGPRVVGAVAGQWAREKPRNGHWTRTGQGTLGRDLLMWMANLGREQGKVALLLVRWYLSG